MPQQTKKFIDEVSMKGDIVATHPMSYLKGKATSYGNISLVMLIAKGNKILLARRAKDKHPYPDTWAYGAGGHALPGESAEDAAKREMREEIGKTCSLKKIISFVYRGRDKKEILSVFATKVPISPEELDLDKKEIQYMRAFTYKELANMVKGSPNECSPTLAAAIKVLSQYPQSAQLFQSAD